MTQRPKNLVVNEKQSKHSLYSKISNDLSSSYVSTLIYFIKCY